jgi:type II secretion system protein N
MKIDWNVWRPRLGYAAFALVSFLLALRWTFPADAVKQRLILEAAAQGWQIDAASVGPGGLLGVRAEAVTADDGAGLKIPIDRLEAAIRLAPLLVGRRSVAFAAHLYDGDVHGTTDVAGADRRLSMKVDGVDLARVLPLRRAAGVDVAGKVVGTAELTVPATGLARAAGRIDVAVKGAAVGPGQLPIPGMSTSFALPRLGLGEVVAGVKLDQGKATFEKLEAKGGDAELSTQDLYAVLQPRLEFSPLSGRAKLKVQDAFWGRTGNPALKGLADAALASAKGHDGAWSFQVSGSVGKPLVRPAPAQ